MKQKKNFKNACGQILKSSLIFSIALVLIACHFVSAETIIIEPGSEDQILDQQSDAEHEVDASTTVTLDKEAMDDLLEATRGSEQEKAYLKALNQRDIERENRDDEIIETLRESNADKDETIKKQDEKIDGLEADVEGLNSQLLGLDSQINIFKKFVIPLVAFVSVGLTVLFMEFTYSLTKRKKLYFKLRNLRDNMPLNFGMLLGRDKE